MTMEMSGLLMALQHILDVWRFVSVRLGAPSVIARGHLLMPMCCAGSWDSPDTVSPVQCTYHVILIGSGSIDLQYSTMSLVYVHHNLQ